jgi:N-acyl homoserine lactone hydrolase
MITLDVLTFGNLVRGEDGKITEANSTATLIRADGRLIVVDTSTPYMRPAIKTAFKQIGVFPKDVDTVVLTHSHSDHIGNLDMFQNAKVLIRAEEAGNIEGAEAVSSDMTIAKGVRLVHTPGHTKGSMSVFADGDLKYAVVGDAIPLKDNVKKMVPPGVNHDADLAMKSIKTIIEYADMVIPGHDSPFMTRM